MGCGCPVAAYPAATRSVVRDVHAEAARLPRRSRRRAAVAVAGRATTAGLGLQVGAEAASELKALPPPPPPPPPPRALPASLAAVALLRGFGSTWLALVSARGSTAAARAARRCRHPGRGERALPAARPARAASFRPLPAVGPPRTRAAPVDGICRRHGAPPTHGAVCGSAVGGGDGGGGAPPGAPPPRPMCGAARPRRRRPRPRAAAPALAAAAAAAALSLVTCPSLGVAQTGGGGCALPPGAVDFACAVGVTLEPSPNDCSYLVRETIALPAGPARNFTRVLPAPPTLPDVVPVVTFFQRTSRGGGGGGGGGGGAPPFSRDVVVGARKIIAWAVPAGVATEWELRYNVRKGIATDLTAACGGLGFVPLPLAPGETPPPGLPGAPPPPPPTEVVNKVGNGNETFTHVLSWSVPAGTLTADAVTVGAGLINARPSWEVVGAAAAGVALATTSDAVVQVVWAPARLDGAADGLWVAWLQPRETGPVGAPGRCPKAGCAGR
ncbi:hypothetical protein BU14_0027s0101 [Porphyra umbilicalis]|uniref:Uncharacterized protein n=1 Tax=Porphyra umbilicalis TaxID=2786 RepID=A0A1X6PJV5_PORUM|nr:hypothetical protein BU14_0027s0101 [Porphyra umbilicalis]|eukprot:OSX81075.1 hypothetical protein BU14_0027s0101 [Porphyra umbilicalis]